MPITRYWISIREGYGYDYIEDEHGDWVLYEDHLTEVAHLEHIISGAEAEIHRQAEEIARLREQLTYYEGPD